jgi:hypothetical protein
MLMESTAKWILTIAALDIILSYIILLIRDLDAVSARKHREAPVIFFP